VSSLCLGSIAVRHYIPTEERKSSRRAQHNTHLRAEESKLAAPWWAFPQLQNGSKERHHDPLPKGCGMFIPRSEGVQEDLEFKKSSTWSTTLGLRHVYLPVCGWKSQVTSSRHVVVCLLAKNLMKLLYICTCVFFDLWYFRVRVSPWHSACDKKFSVQLDPCLVQRKYIFRIYVSKLITTQSASSYKVVLVSTLMVIVIVLLIQHVSL